MNGAQPNAAAMAQSQAVVRPSTLIAEALVERQSPRQIVARACALGLSDPKLEVILAACGSTAGSVDGVPVAQPERKATGGICQAR